MSCTDGPTFILQSPATRAFPRVSDDLHQPMLIIQEDAGHARSSSLRPLHTLPNNLRDSVPAYDVGHFSRGLWASYSSYLSLVPHFQRPSTFSPKDYISIVSPCLPGTLHSTFVFLRPTCLRACPVEDDMQSPRRRLWRGELGLSLDLIRLIAYLQVCRLATLLTRLGKDMSAISRRAICQYILVLDP